ncbi:MAG: hypothetical protein M0P71_01035 [Melioribacteraceae bacterium]|nr:hypothetical protein [Melioribacteraceae bacterium]
MKYCKDCRHFIKIDIGGYNLCKKSRQVLTTEDVVSGKISTVYYNDCKDCRTGTYRTINICGEEARLFSHKNIIIRLVQWIKSILKGK